MIIRQALPEKNIPLAAASGYAFFLGILVVVDIRLSIVTAILPFIIWFTLTGKNNLLFILLLFLPFHSAPIFAQNLMGIQGAKPFNMITAITLISCLYYAKGSPNSKDDLRRSAIVFFGIYYAIFALATLRSLDYLPLLHMLNPELFPASPLSYILSNYIKRGFYGISFIYILIHVTSQVEIKRTITVINMSLMVLALSIILIALLQGTINITGRSSEIWNDSLGLHYNELGTILIIGAPLLLMPALRGNFLGILGYCLGLCAVVFLESRTAILLYLLASFMFASSQGKRYLVIGIFIVGILAFFPIPEFLLETLQIGMDNGDVQVDRVMTGRTDMLWRPLFSELIHNPKLFLFGRGLYGIMATTSFQQGEIFQTTLAHNAFIDFILDCGFILFAAFIYYLIKFLQFSWQQIYTINNDTGWALFISIIAFLMACITGRQFLPSTHSIFLFPVIALLVNTFRHNINVHANEH